jgi:Flp pilus assembly pilin Flp
MGKVIARLRAFLGRDDGASLVEYAVGLLLIAVITIASIALLGNALSNFFANASTSI